MRRWRRAVKLKPVGSMRELANIRTPKLGDGLPDALNICSHLLNILRDMKDYHAKVRGLNEARKDVSALLCRLVRVRYVDRYNDEELFRVGMEDQVYDGASDLLGRSRFDLHGDGASDCSIDSGHSSPSVANFKRRSPVGKRLADRLAHQALPVAIEVDPFHFQTWLTPRV